MNGWAVALLPLAGVLLGAALQFLLGRAGEREKHLASLRSQAYADYLQAVAAAAHINSDEAYLDALKSAADAKARIAVYGTASVIKMLARFEREGAALNTDAAVKAFVGLVSAMRPDSGGVTDQDLRLVLVGQESSTPVGSSQQGQE
jgi:hypothetical protein